MSRGDDSAPLTHTDRFARQHRFLRRVLCPACGAAPSVDCVEVENAAQEIRKRGAMWHHRTRFERSLHRGPSAEAERAQNAAKLHRAPTSRNPRPGPPPPRLEPLSGLGASLDSLLRGSLRGLSTGSDPLEVRDALAAAGLRLPLAVVEAWLDRLSVEHPGDEEAGAG